MDMYGPSSPSTQAPFSVSITQAVGKEANANVCFNGRSWDGSILLAFPFGRLAGQCARSKTKLQQKKIENKKKNKANQLRGACGYCMFHLQLQSNPIKFTPIIQYCF